MFRFICICDKFLEELNIVKKDVPNYRDILDDILQLIEKPKVTFRLQLLEFSLTTEIFQCCKYKGTKYNNLTKQNTLKIFRNGKSDKIPDDVNHLFFCLRHLPLPCGSVGIVSLSEKIVLSKLQDDELTNAFDTIIDSQFRFRTKCFHLTLQEMDKLNIDWKSMVELFPLLNGKDGRLFVNILRLLASESL